MNEGAGGVDAGIARFLVTGTQSFIYVHIIAAMIIMIPLFYIVIGKTRLSGD